MAAYALLVLGGNEKPSADDVSKLLKEAGVAADSDKINDMIEKVKGKSFHELVTEGLDAMGKMGGPAPAAAAATTAADKPAEAEDEKQEEKEDVDMGNLFGGDDEYY